MDEAGRSVVGRRPTVAVDFDHTLAGDGDIPIPGAREAMIRLREAGWKVIVWTSRPDTDHVRGWMAKNGIPYDHINENPEVDEAVYTRKVSFDAVVDDKAVSFRGNWGDAVAELERRRMTWEAAGEIKAVSLFTAGNDGSSRELARFEISGGAVVETTGTTNQAVLDIMERGADISDGDYAYPADGERFLKGLLEIQGAYLWAEASDKR